MLLSPTCFNLKCCEVAKNIRIIHVNVSLCVCVRFVALPHVKITERFNPLSYYVTDFVQ